MGKMIADSNLGFEPITAHIYTATHMQLHRATVLRTADPDEAAHHSFYVDDVAYALMAHASEVVVSWKLIVGLRVLESEWIETAAWGNICSEYDVLAAE